MTHKSISHRYFFGTGETRDELTYDEEGLELADDEEARRQVLTALPCIAQDPMPECDNRMFYVGVKNDCGRIVYMASMVIHGEWIKA